MRRLPSIAASALVAMAIVAALARVASGSQTARLAGGAVAAMLAGVLTGTLRSKPWALGVAFFLGLFTLWAVLALAIRGDLSLPGALFGIAWSMAVMTATVRSRNTDA